MRLLFCLTDPPRTYNIIPLLLERFMPLLVNVWNNSGVITRLIGHDKNRKGNIDYDRENQLKSKVKGEVW